MEVAVTYAWCTREWAMRKMSQHVFGRDAIARAISAPPRTVGTWWRQSMRRSPLTLSVPREDPRALGIAMLELFPKRPGEIALLIYTNPRTLKDWLQIRNEKRFASDLYVRTRQLLEFYRRVMPEYLEINDEGMLFLTQGRFPSAWPVYQDVWDEYDSNLESMLQVQEILRLSNFLDKFPTSLTGPDPYFLHKIELRRNAKRLVGPHKCRGLAHDPYTHEDFQLQTRRRRVVGRFNERSPNFRDFPEDTFST